MVIDAIALQEGIPMNKHKHKATVGFGTIENIPVLLIKPATFMNLSGESVKDAMQHYKVSTSYNPFGVMLLDLTFLRFVVCKL